MSDSVNQLLKGKAVCGTAPATTGLLITSSFILEMKLFSNNWDGNKVIKLSLNMVYQLEKKSHQ